MKKLQKAAGLLALLLLVPALESHAQLDAVISLIGKIKDAAILTEQLTELRKMTQNLQDVYEQTAGAIQGFKAVKDVYSRGEEVSASIRHVADLMAKDHRNDIYSAGFKSQVKAGVDDALDELSLAEENVATALRAAKLNMKERLDMVNQGMEHMNKAMVHMKTVEAASLSTYDNYQIAAERADYFTVIYSN